MGKGSIFLKREEDLKRRYNLEERWEEKGGEVNLKFVTIVC